MFDKGQMAGLMKKAQEMQKSMEYAKNKINATEVHSTSANNLISITLMGDHSIKKIEIDQSLLADKEMLEDIIVVALNDAVKKVEEMRNEQMKNSGVPTNLGGFNLPL